METYKPQPLKERRSQKLSFWDYAKEHVFWAVLPLLAGGAAMLFGKITKFKIFPLDGSTDLLTTLHAYLVKHFAKNHARGEELVKWVKDGMWPGAVITEFGGKNKEMLRKYYFNFIKGAEVAAPFSVYFLWHKKEGKRLDLQEVGDKLKGMQNLKPTDAELAEQNEVMRRELKFTAQQGNVPPAIIDKDSVERHGRLVERQKEHAS